MKTLIVIALAGAISACECGTLNNSRLAHMVQNCTKAKLDYSIEYNKKGKPTDVICYKPGFPPPDASKYPEITTVPASLEYVQ